MVKVKILDYIYKLMSRMAQRCIDLVSMFDALRYGALMEAQTQTYKAMCLVKFEIENLKEEHNALATRYDYIQHLKEEYNKNDKE